MKAVEALRRLYQEKDTEKLGLPRSAGGYGVKVFAGQGMTDKDVLRILSLPPDTSAAAPMQDPATGDLYYVPGLDPPGSRPIPPTI